MIPQQVLAGATGFRLKHIAHLPSKEAAQAGRTQPLLSSAWNMASFKQWLAAIRLFHELCVNQLIESSQNKCHHRRGKKELTDFERFTLLKSKPLYNA